MVLSDRRIPLVSVVQFPDLIGNLAGELGTEYDVDPWNLLLLRSCGNLLSKAAM